MRRKLFRTFFLMILPLILSPSCNIGNDASREQHIFDFETSKAMAVEKVHSAAVAIGDMLKDDPDSAARVLAIRKYISPIRFYDDSSGYFYVYNFDCFNIAHATQKDLQGKDMYDYQDVQGKYVIRELSRTAARGRGFVQFHWIKPGEKGEKLKIGYVEPIPGTTFFIGSGVYIPE